MISDKTADNTFPANRALLPAHLNERAARVTNDPHQYSIAAFESAEALLISRLIRADIKRDRIELAVRKEQLERYP